MPSFLHEILLEMFRKRAELAPELLRACAGIELAGDTVEISSGDLSQIAPAEFRADAVVVVRDRARVVTAAVIVEIQLHVDATKRRTWPVYVTTLRASLACPVTLLVLVPEEPIARWARRPIELGHPGFWLRPIVVSYADVPRVTDLARARQAPELAVLSALAHPEPDIAAVALEAISGQPEDVRTLYWDVIMAALPELARKTLEARMKGYEYQSEFVRTTLAKGREEGREEGLQNAAIELARSKLGAVSAELERRLRGVSDQRMLNELIVGLGCATGAPEAQAILDRALPPG